MSTLVTDNFNIIIRNHCRSPHQ